MAPNMDTRKTVVGGRRIRSIVVGLGMTLVLGAPVAAAPLSESRFFERGHQASAHRGVCRTAPDSDITTCRSLSVQVFSGRRGGTDPATRFRGHDISVSKGRHKENHVTGQILGSRSENGHVANSESLLVRFDRIRGATVEGTIRVRVQSCDRRGECVDSHRRMTLDLAWTARPGPASDSFTYFRYSDDGCETTHTDTRRGRRARTVGQVDTDDVRMRGWLISTDVLRTQVCQ